MKLTDVIRVGGAAAFTLMVLIGAVPARADFDKAIGQFQMPEVREPRIPPNRVDITQYGAVPDGQTLNTEAIARAIDALAKAGGGRVVIPAGIWLTGPIQLKSSIELHLEEGALVQFTREYDKYPLHEIRIKDHVEMAVTAPIWADGAEDIAITGRGVIDGGGDAWRPVKAYKMTSRQWRDLVKSGGVVNGETGMWWPTQEASDAASGKIEMPQGSTDPRDWEPLRVFMRPQLVKLVGCRRVLLEGVTFQNSPAWNLNTTVCEDLTVRSVTVRNPWYSQNGDGLDLESCRNVAVIGSQFDVGDDAICLKTVGEDELGRRLALPTENILIRDCTVYHGHGGFVVGSEMSGGVRNICVDNCVFIGTDVGLRFKSKRGRGGVVEHVYISDITMTDIPTEAVLFDLYYEGAAPLDGNGNLRDPQRQAQLVSDETPQFRDIYMKRIVCRGAARAALLQGLPEMPLRGIHMEDVSISAEQGIVVMDARDISISNVEVLAKRGPVFQMSGCRDVLVDSLRYSPAAPAVFSLHGTGNADITLRNTGLDGDGDFQLVHGATKDALNID
jgi:polygalacturonase